MLGERVRFMYLTRDGSDIKQISLSWRKFVLFVFLFALIVGGITAATLSLATRLYQNYRISYLENDREQLQTELLKVKEKVLVLRNQIVGIEKQGDELRNVANLKPIDNDVRQVGVGYTAYSEALSMNYSVDQIHRTAAEVKFDLEKLERTVRLEKSSMSEIAARLRDLSNRRNHLPSIEPILGGPIISPFGWRIDPFTQRNAFHEGIDIAMPKGTKILATADGIVSYVRSTFSPHKGYGMYVIIDHGFGYKTRYAHCSKILVKPGQKVKRWQVIAEVGKTGRAEGYHLHYEVMVNDKKVDPEDFILG
ncbi:M23 family metallopeptidase [bacterium]|nr:M23 family metallopeptidase [bacterium]